MRRFVIGDIHGAHKALIQCLERSEFDKEEDLLVSLGDLCDGWPDVDKVLDELLNIRKLILILGNHDQWLIEWFKTGKAPGIWLMQGGSISVESFKNGIKAAYMQLMETAKPYYVLENMLFVHGGILTDRPLDQQDEEVFCWDRSLVKTLLINKIQGNEKPLTSYKKVFVGHTPTINFEEADPIVYGGVCMIDTGAGWAGGTLSMMDIDKMSLFKSDKVDMLYKDFSGRSGI